MKIAVEGCAHGELEMIYETIASIEEKYNMKVDLLLCCGDFQATRNMDDLQTMAVPPKYRSICTFYKYYSGEKTAPILTIFIGGNHEASNYLQELPYGGWVATNIYYMGYAGVVRVNGVRIAGLSGIHKGYDYLTGHHEYAPYNVSTRKSVYHVRQLEVFRLKQLSGQIDIIMSHDWPRGIYNYGNKEQLGRFKPFLRQEMDDNQMGSEPCETLLKMLKPRLWFAAHMHCKFSALVPHDVVDADLEEALPSGDDNDENVATTAAGRQQQKQAFTKFLALDKCLPKRQFLQILDVDADPADGASDDAVKIEYDLEWLTILRATNHLINVKKGVHYMPSSCFTPTDDDMQATLQRFDANLRIPLNFCRTAYAFNPNEQSRDGREPKPCINPQTRTICNILDIADPLTLAMAADGLAPLQYDDSDDVPDEMTPVGDIKRRSLNLPSVVNEHLSDVTATADDRFHAKHVNDDNDQIGEDKSTNNINKSCETQADNNVATLASTEVDDDVTTLASTEVDNNVTTTLASTEVDNNVATLANTEADNNVTIMLTGNEVENVATLVSAKVDNVATCISMDVEAPTDGASIDEKPPKRKFMRRNESIYSKDDDQ